MKIIKIDSSGKEYNYGAGYKDAYEVIPKNYKFNGLFYESKETKKIYIKVGIIMKEKTKEILLKLKQKNRGDIYTEDFNLKTRDNEHTKIFGKNTFGTHCYVLYL